MKTATRKTESMNLGTKRACPHCATKFYDFNKDEISCPKCKASLDIKELAKTPVLPVEAKKPKVEKTVGDDPLVAEETPAAEGPEAIESLDELGDDEEEVVEDLDVEEEEDEGSY